MPTTVILKLIDNVNTQLARMDNKLVRIEEEIKDLDHRLVSYEQLKIGAEEAKCDLASAISEIRKQLKIYKKYFYICALITVATAIATFGYEKVLMFLKAIFKIM